MNCRIKTVSLFIIALLCLSGCGKEDEKEKKALEFLTEVHKEVSSYCSKDRNPPPSSGIQFDGAEADSTIMNLKTGIYMNDESYMIMLFENNSYAFILPKAQKDIRDSGGDDNVVISKSYSRLEGCYLEQLSEILRSYELDPTGFERR
jgi:hypothetical protein